MILKMMNTENGNVLIDNIEQITRVGITRDLGETVEIIGKNKIPVLRKKEEVLCDILSHYNMPEKPDVLQVFNLVIRSVVDNRKEFRTVLFTGPGFLMNDTGFTISAYEIPE